MEGGRDLMSAGAEGVREGNEGECHGPIYMEAHNCQCMERL